jgi:hypothetical protein
MCDDGWLCWLCLTSSCMYDCIIWKIPSKYLMFLIKHYLCLIASKWSQEVSKSLDKMPNHPNSKLSPIFTYVKGFSFQILVLSSYVPSMTMYLPIFHLCQLIFHSLHYYLVNWGHLLIISLLILTLINLVAICISADSLLFKLLNFKINSVGSLICPTSLLLDLL